MLRTGEAAGPRLIAENDLVVVYERFDSMKAVRVKRGGTFNNKFGAFMLKVHARRRLAVRLKESSIDRTDWIGQPYGSRLYAKAPSRGWVYVLEPTPELWTAVLRHRTQILYAADIALAVALMGLAPGATVIESGTGSGSMTTSLARAVAPRGRVHTFEFHEQRARLAAQEFEDNGLSGVVALEHRDVEARGFPEALHGAADALFLDLPAPWRVVPSAAACLRPDGVFCSFSPCIEQVQRTCKELNAHGFRGMRTMEILLRQYEVVNGQQATDIDALLQPAPPPAARGAKRPRPGSSRGPSEEQAVGAAVKGAAATNGRELEMAQEAAGAGAGRPDERDAPAAVEATEREAVQPADVPMPDAAAMPGTAAAVAVRAAGQQQKRALCRPVAEGRGHTGYLTFARKAV
eukprot:scaffold18.g1934.t1